MSPSVGARLRHRHPANIQYHDRASFGQRAADKLSGAVGSWRFVIVQAGAFAAWILLNGLSFTRAIHVDAWPFMALNLFMSAEAAFATSVLLIASNRQAAKDRMTLEQTYADAESQIKELKRIAALTLAMARQTDIDVEKLLADVEAT